MESQYDINKTVRERFNLTDEEITEMNKRFSSSDVKDLTEVQLEVLASSNHSMAKDAYAEITRRNWEEMNGKQAKQVDGLRRELKQSKEQVEAQKREEAEKALRAEVLKGKSDKAWSDLLKSRGIIQPDTLRKGEVGYDHREAIDNASNILRDSEKKND